MTRVFLLAHFKWHRTQKMKTADDYPVTITKKHYYRVSDGISYMELFCEQDVADYCDRRGFKFGKAKKKNIF